MTWLSEAARLAVFPSADADGMRGTLPPWAAFTGSEPVNRIVPSAGLVVENGPWDGDWLEVRRFSNVPMRLDIILGGSMPESPDRPPSLGDAARALERILSHTAPILGMAMPILRIGVGVTCHDQAATVDKAFEKLAGHIDPTRFELTNVRDFVYQLNRRTTSAVLAGLAINRLARWNCTVGRFQLDESLGPEIICAAVDVDVNTAGDRTEPLPPDSLDRLFGELRSEALRLTREGDRR